MLPPPVAETDPGFRPFQALLDPQAIQSVCEALTPEDCACARLGCRSLHNGCSDADARAGGRVASLSVGPFFRSVALAAWYEAQRPGGELPEDVLQYASMLAVAQGSAEALEWARGKGSPWSISAMGLDTNHALDKQVFPEEPHMTIISGVATVAARYGHLAALQWAIAKGCPWDSQTCSSAAQGGHLEVLQWALANGCPWDAGTCSEAARHGHLEVLQWARANGCPWTERTCTEAAGHGHLELLQWARAQGCPWHMITCARAAGGGHLEVLQWARANGCPWDATMCMQAAEGGHLEVLHWARANGCPWNRSICQTWAEERHPFMLAWINSVPL